MTIANMKNYLLLAICLFTSLLYSQNRGINFQSVIYDIQGNPSSNEIISLKFSIKSIAGEVLYLESTTLETDSRGVVNHIIGSGIYDTAYGPFSNIDWNRAQKVEILTTTQNGNSETSSQFFVAGSTDLSTVPFSVVAEKVYSDGITLDNKTLQAETVQADYGFFANVVTATAFYGDGSGLTNINVAASIKADENRNLVIGDGLQNNTTGFDNTTAGFESLSENTAGNWNTAYGSKSLRNNTTGSNNTAIGAEALRSNSTGDNNVSVGALSMMDNQTGRNNIALGYYTLTANVSGTDNIAIGSNALDGSSGATRNIAIGSNSLGNNLNGGENISIGYNSLLNTEEGHNNIAIGNYSLSGESVWDNVAIGSAAGNGLEHGIENVFIGYGSKASQDEERITNSTAIGANAVIRKSNTIQLGNNQIESVETSGIVSATGFIGDGSGLDNINATVMADENRNLGVGNTFGEIIIFPPSISSPTYYDLYPEDSQNSGPGRNNISISPDGMQNLIDGRQNVSIGSGALENNEHSSDNVAIGYNAANELTQGGFNTTLGYGAMKNGDGWVNVAIGSTAMYNNQGSMGAVAIGSGSLEEALEVDSSVAIGLDASHESKFSQYNVAIGARSLYNVGRSLDQPPNQEEDRIAATKNVAVGFESQMNNDSGHNNVSVGAQSMVNNREGFDNVAVGTYAGQRNNGISNTFLGYQSDLAEGTNQNQTRNSVALGANAKISGSNMIQLGDNQIELVQTTGVISATAFVGDGSGLTNINSGSSKLDELSDVTYIDGTNSSGPSLFIGNDDSRFESLTVSNTNNNVGVGPNTLTDIRGGGNNTALGTAALRHNEFGSFNTAVGTGALENNKGSGNTAVGNQTLVRNVSGNNNSAFGTDALRENQSSGNTAFGAYALSKNVSGTVNTAVGDGALSNNINGEGNTGIGYASLRENQSGFTNVAVGQNTLMENISGSSNTAIGFGALANNISGGENIAIGPFAMSESVSSTGRIAIGNGALISNSGGANIGIGSWALAGTESGTNTGFRNVAVGPWALTDNDTGFANVAIGVNALAYNLTGERNTAVGDDALFYNESGISNSAFGDNALLYNVDGSNNSAFGKDALKDNQSSGNTAFGAYALSKNVSGTVNTAVGDGALSNNINGEGNTGIGYASLRENQSGFTNVAVGQNTLMENISGSGNTAVGYRSGQYNVNGGNNTFIGDWSRTVSYTDVYNATAIGSGAVVEHSNTIQLGNEQVNMVKTSGAIMADGGLYSNIVSASSFYGDGSGLTGITVNNLSGPLTELTVNGTTTLKGETFIENTLLVPGVARINDLDVMGLTRIYQAELDNADIDGGTARFFDLEVNGPTRLEGLEVVHGNTMLNGDLDVSGNAKINGRLEVNGVFEAIPGSSVLHALNNIEVFGDLRVREKLIAQSSLSSDGNLEVMGFTDLKSDLEVNGRMRLDGELELNSDANIFGRVRADRFEGDGSGLTNIRSEQILGVQVEPEAVSVGIGAYASQAKSSAFGTDARADHFNSTAIGFGATTSMDDMIQLGDDNITMVKTSGAIMADGGLYTSVVSASSSIYASNYYGDGSGLTGINTNQIDGISVDFDRVEIGIGAMAMMPNSVAIGQGAEAMDPDMIQLGNPMTQRVRTYGTVEASRFEGDGSGLTGINTNQIDGISVDFDRVEIGIGAMAMMPNSVAIGQGAEAMDPDMIQLGNPMTQRVRTYGTVEASRFEGDGSGLTGINTNQIDGISVDFDRVEIGIGAMAMMPNSVAIGQGAEAMDPDMIQLGNSMTQRVRTYGTVEASRFEGDGSGLTGINTNQIDGISVDFDRVEIGIGAMAMMPNSVAIGQGAEAMDPDMIQLGNSMTERVRTYGTVEASRFEGDGSGLTGINTAQIEGVTVTPSRIEVGIGAMAMAPNSVAIGDGAMVDMNESDLIQLGNSMTGRVRTYGTVEASRFEGDGSGLTGINTAQIEGVTVTPSRIEVGIGAMAMAPNSVAIGDGAMVDMDESDLIQLGNSMTQRVRTSGTVEASRFEGDGSGLTGINTGQIEGVTVDYDRVEIGIGAMAMMPNSVAIGQGAEAMDPDMIQLGNSMTQRVRTSGTVEASRFEGDGSGLTGINTNQIDGISVDFDRVEIGIGAMAMMPNSVAIGQGAEAMDPDMIQLGNPMTQRVRTYGTVEALRFEGDGSGLTNISAEHILGVQVEPEAVSLGIGAYASMNNSLAIGSNARADHDNSAAIGTGAQTTDSDMIQLGNDAVTLVQTAGTVSASAFVGDGSGLTNISLPHSYNNADNSFFGHEAGSLLRSTNNSNNTTGNFGAGPFALEKLTSGDNNLAIGYRSLSVANDANDNIALGSGSLRNTSSGSQNISLGVSSLRENRTGSGNTAVGSRALRNNSSGSGNTAVGENAAVTNYNSNNATFIGSNSGASSALDNATAIGAGAIVDTDNSIQLGNDAVTLVQTSGTVSASAFVGDGSSLTGITAANLSGPLSNLTVNGNTALNGDTSISGSNLSITANTTLSNELSVSGDTYLYGPSLYISGFTSLSSDLNVSGNTTVAGILSASRFEGDGSGITNIDGSQLTNIDGANITNLSTTIQADDKRNIAVGGGLSQNIDGFNNTALGYNSMQFNTQGNYNAAFGELTLEANTTGSNNVAVGSKSLSRNTTGDNNVSVGGLTMMDNTSGRNNVAVGYYTLVKNTTGQDNIAMGSNALDDNLEGSNNISIGSNSLGTLSSGSNNIAIGKDAGSRSNEMGVMNPATGIQDAIFIGSNANAHSNLENITVIGTGAYGYYSNSMVFGSPTVTSWSFGRGYADSNNALQVGMHPGNGNGAYLTKGGVWTNASSLKLKNKFFNLDEGWLFDKIKNLDILQWNYIGTDETHIGPTSEQFIEMFGVGNGDDKHLSTLDVSGVALRAVQGLISRDESKEEEIQELKSEISELKEQIELLKSLIESKN